MDFSVSMALFDFIPVILYAVSSAVLQQGLYSRMTRGGFAAYCGGCTLVTVAGAYKALWKLLYALNICDIQALNYCFMPIQAIGFLIAGAALTVYVFSKRGKECAPVLYAVPVFTGSMPFIFGMVLGLFFVQLSYAVIAARKKRYGAMVLFTAGFFLQMAMGYLSTKDFSQAYMNWAAEAVNTAAMLTLLFGARDLRRNVLTEPA